MTTASAVPETHSLEGDDATETLRSTGIIQLVKDAFTRFRTADGFSHARAMGHAAVLVTIPSLIAVIALASLLDLGTFREVLHHTLQRLAPGPAGDLLTQAFRQGSRSSSAGVVVGAGIGAIVSGTFAMALIERGSNRCYGMVRDRTIAKKFGTAFLLAVSAGILLALAFLLLAAGAALGEGLTRGADWSDATGSVFGIVRWPLGLLCVFAGLTLIYKISPNRQQPSWAWLQTGTIVATLLWSALTALLALYYSISNSLGGTYGALVGIIALLTWTYATGLALLYGASFAAQLEAVRAGVPGPRTYRRFNEVVRDPEETIELDSRPTLQPVAPGKDRPDAVSAASSKRSSR